MSRHHIIEPAVHFVVEPERIVRVCAGVACSLPVRRVHLVEVSAVRDRLEAGHLNVKEMRRHLFQATVMHLPKNLLLFERQHPAEHGVIAGWLNNRAVSAVGKHSLERQVVCDFHTLCIQEHPLFEDSPCAVGVLYIEPVPVRQRNVVGHALLHREAEPHNVGFMRVERGLRLVPEFSIRRGFVVECDGQ